MDPIRYYENGVATHEWDDDSETYTERDKFTGGVIEQRSYNDEEKAFKAERAESAAEIVNEAELVTKANQALTVNSAWLNRSVAPTNAQAVAQIDRLTRQVNGLIRFELRDFTDISDT